MTLLDAAALATFLALTAVLLYGVLSIYVGAHRPGDRPTWGDLVSMLKGIAHEVRAGFQRIAGLVVKS